MRKIISITLAAIFVMAMSTFAVCAAPYENYPYLYETFNEDTVSANVEGKKLSYGAGTSVSYSESGIVGGALTVKEETQRYEAEDYIAGDTAYKTESWSEASGGTIVSNNMPSGTSNTYKNYKDEIIIPVTVTETGIYDVQAAFSDPGTKLPEYYSWVHVYLDGTKIDSNWWGAGKAISTYTSSPYKDAPIRVRRVAGKNLSAGEHEIKLEIDCAGSYGNSAPYFSLDYVELVQLKDKATSSNPQPQATFAMSGKMEVGQNMSYSCFVKPDKAVKSQKVEFVLNGTDSADKAATHIVTKDCTLNANVWNYVEAEEVWSGALSTVNSVAIRLGSGDVVKETSSQSMTYLLDDVIIEPKNIHETSDVKADVIWGEEADISLENLNISYTYAGTNSEGKSIARILRSEGGNWITISTQEVSGGAFVVQIPDEAVGKDLKVEFVPVDNAGTFGPVYEKVISNIKVGFMVLPEITSFGLTAESKTTITLNAVDLGTQNMVIILAVYDDNNTLIHSNSEAVTVAVGTNNLEVNVSANTVTERGTGTHAKLFVWGGTSLDASGEKIYTDVVVKP